MKLTISSPDGLGDFILRVPMIRALLDNACQLQIFMRQPAADLAKEIFPDVEIHIIDNDPYFSKTRCKKNPFLKEHAAIHSFCPDLYVASLFALNFFDEVWFENDRRVPVAGFSTAEEFWPSGTISDPSVLSREFCTRVEVPVAIPELEKNRLLGSAILGKNLPAGSPRLEPGNEALVAAREILKHHRLMEGGYWIACVGSRSGLRMKDWGEENWKTFFSSVLPGDDHSVVFIGNPKEWESIERIRAGGFRSINLASEPPAIPVSLALIAMSCGYVGRDSGVMHMASALGRPVLAVFGGGHWGRFLPSSGPAVAVTQAMSCRMCDFACPHEKPHCITEISMQTMVEAWRRLPIVSGIEVIEQAIDRRFDTVSGDAAMAFAIARSGESREREADGRTSPWQRFFLGSGRRK